MAVGDMTLNIRLVPDKVTMSVVLNLLDMWQEDNPDKMIAMVPKRERYGYEIIERGEHRDE